MMKKLFNQSGIIHTLPLLVIVAAVGIISYLLISSTAPFKGGLFGILNPQPASNAQVMMGGPEDPQCGLGNSMAFCDTFNQPFPITRSGQLDPSKWSIARVSGYTDPVQADDVFVPAKAMHCKDPISNVLPDNDYFMCGLEVPESEHFMDAFDDATSYVYNSARIRQPFDFANRTGTVVFDVDAKTAGSHSWWIEVWVTDEPIPGPHINHDSAVPRNGFGLAFHNNCGIGQPEGSDIGSGCGAIGEFMVARDYQVIVDMVPWSGTVNGITWTPYDSYKTEPDVRNHFELKMNQQHLELWATDAGGTTLKKIGVMDNMNLPFTRGYVHFEHAGYNAAKFGASSSQTYHWDNIGFDGPVVPTPTQYSIPDSLKPAGFGGVTVGYAALQAGVVGGPLSFNNVSLGNATSALLTFNTWFGAGQDINYKVNGGPWHFWHGSDPEGGSMWKSAAVSVNLSELHNGTNTVDFGGPNWDSKNDVANIDLVLYGGINGPLPTTVPVPSFIPTPTPTPFVPTPAPTAVPSGNFVQGSSATPQSPQSSVSLPYNFAQSSGDTNIVAVGWSDMTSNISSITDSVGNSYQVAAPIARGSGHSQAIYYAKNIIGGANTVTVTFNQAANFVDIRLLEYRGLDQTNPLDVTASASGAGAGTANSGMVTTTSASELLFGAGMTGGGFTGAGTGFTNRIITNPDADLAEDEIVSSVGNYCATAPVSDAWLMQVATFRLANSQAPTPSPSTCPKGVMGDIDCNGVIDIFDFNILTGNFGKTVPANTQGDLDGDGKVGIFDFNILIGNFGK